MDPFQTIPEHFSLTDSTGKPAYGPEFDTFTKKLFVKLVSAIFISFLIITHAYGQADSLKTMSDSAKADRSLHMHNVERNGEVLPEVEIPEVTVYAPPHFENKKDFRKYQKLVYNLKKTYPYAVVVRKRLARVNDDMKNFKTERERKDYMKKVEKDVFAEYEGDMRNMTITQGRLLIKLIDRETQNTSYELIKDYRGKLAASFWQGVARIFGTNLKSEYDPEGEDALIEMIIQEIDAGRL